MILNIIMVGLELKTWEFKMRNFKLGIAAVTIFTSTSSFSSIEQAKQLEGCYLVDYNYSETESLKQGYQLDPRVYDVSGFVVKELVKVVEESEDRVRLQHFMQADDKSGRTMFMMRHHGEIWKINPEFRYKYEGRYDGNDKWTVEDTSMPWLRSVTNLDDGIRYQCLGDFKSQSYYSEFNCSAYSPIPGRETRDMGRKDYNTMQRSTSVKVFGNSWLEKQLNTKTIFDNGHKTPLAKEIGKVWSVRLADSDCSEVDSWRQDRQVFWNLLSEVWQEVLDGSSDFNELKLVDGTTRTQKISKLMGQYLDSLLSSKDDVGLVKEKIREIIEMHRQ